MIEALLYLTVFQLHIRQYKKYNTILASSASSERPFSKGKLVFNTKRHSLTDNHFEQQLILNCNKEMTME